MLTELIFRRFTVLIRRMRAERRKEEREGNTEIERDRQIERGGGVDERKTEEKQKRENELKTRGRCGMGPPCMLVCDVLLEYHKHPFHAYTRCAIHYKPRQERRERHCNERHNKPYTRKGVIQSRQKNIFSHRLPHRSQSSHSARLSWHPHPPRPLASIPEPPTPSSARGAPQALQRSSIQWYPGRCLWIPPSPERRY